MYCVVESWLQVPDGRLYVPLLIPSAVPHPRACLCRDIHSPLLLSYLRHAVQQGVPAQPDVVF